MSCAELHETVKKLKELRYKAEEICTSEDLDILISEVKSEIYKNKYLKDEYAKRINEFETYKEGQKENNKFIYDTITDFVNQYYPVHIKNTNGGYINNLFYCFSSSEVYYFPILRYVMGEKPKDDYEDISKVSKQFGVKDFYSVNISNFILSKEEIDILTRNTKIQKIESFINDNINRKALINVNFYIIESENELLLKRNFISSDPYFTIWMNSALLKVLEVLQYMVKDQLKAKQKEEKGGEEKENNENPSSLKTSNFNLTKIQIAFLRLRKDLPDNSFKNIAEKMSEIYNKNITEATLKTCSYHLRNKLGANTIDQAVAIAKENKII